MMRRNIVLFFAIAALSSASVARAHFAGRQSSLSTYAESAELVVRGVIDASDQAFEGTHSPRSSSGVLRVEEVLKGTTPAARLRFETTGVHQPSYRAGKHVLLFLTRIPESDPPRFLTRQNAIEGADLDGPEGEPLLAAVRGYVEIQRISNREKRLVHLKRAILRELASPTALLWQDAIFDLSKRRDLPLEDADVAEIGRLAQQADKPTVLRVGCVAKLGILGKAGDVKAARALAEVLAAKGEPIVRTMAAAALADTRRPAACPALVAMLDDSAIAVRRAAAEALGRLGDAAAVDPLGDLAGRDPNATVRFAALKAIARIGDAGAEQTLAALPRRSSFADMPQAIDLARREVAQETHGRTER